MVKLVKNLNFVNSSDTLLQTLLLEHCQFELRTIRTCQFVVFVIRINRIICFHKQQQQQSFPSRLKFAHETVNVPRRFGAINAHPIENTH